LKAKITSILFLVLSVLIFAQSSTKTNLDVINSLIDKSVKESINGLPFEDITYFLDFNSASEYRFMENRTKNALGKLVSITDDKNKSLYSLSYTLDEIKIKYLNPEKDGMFGSYKLSRNIEINGSYIIGTLGTSTRSDNFELTYSDTVDFDSVSDLESRSLPFTRGKKPDEPFLASLLEPAIAIGAIAITIVLFFTVRSN
jgi:hypothetical protein